MNSFLIVLGRKTIEDFLLLLGVDTFLEGIEDYSFVLL